LERAPQLAELLKNSEASWMNEPEQRIEGREPGWMA
jgi:hypothetical protein